jgi:hypothetical protein
MLWAAYSNSPQILQILSHVPEIFDVDKIDSTAWKQPALFKSVMRKSLPCIKLLCRYGADLDKTDCKGDTVLQWMEKFFPNDIDGITYFKKYALRERLKNVHGIHEAVSLIKEYRPERKYHEIWRHIFKKDPCFMPVFMNFVFLSITILGLLPIVNLVDLHSEGIFLKLYAATAFGWILFFILILFKKPQVVKKKKLSERDNAIYSIIETLDFQKSAKNIDLDQICFVCLREKEEHTNHCGKCNICVYDQHFHSKIFDKCIGAGNIYLPWSTL